jgi:probable F420-dependent oxidoreductase
VDLGVVMGGDLRGLAARAREAEDAGFESLWVAETARSAFVQAAVVAQATFRALVGTDIALAFPRSPTITAMAARDLAELSGGRFVLGLGSQVKRVNEQRFGVPFEHPAPKLGEAAEAIRAVLGAFDGKPVEHRGRFYEITMPPFPGAGPPPGGRLPLYIAAVNRLMAETAGRVADGILGHPMTSPAYVRDVLRPAAERGALEAGRDGSEINVSTGVILAISDDRDEARREAALQIAFYATTRTYRPVLEMHGLEGLVDPLREAFGRGDLPAMAELALPAVDSLAVAGTADECRTRIEAFDGVADRVILGGAWVGPSPERLAANHRAILATFGSVRR